MNAKRVKRLRKTFRERGQNPFEVEYEQNKFISPCITLTLKCGRSHYQKVKKMYRKFGL